VTRLRRAVGRRGAEGAGSAPKLPLSLVLDNLRSCYNVGSVFRTAETAGLREVRAIRPSARSVSRMEEREARGGGAWSHRVTCSRRQGLTCVICS